ncbi:glutathione S-transferase family protein [Prosthecomicrobium pneumaticum]|uniref:Glutathione S-transferase n=1 Tax=Prosthecomicrobium pneumaticum TaxID=81895 RepID=A0A7W9FQ72_9HYPH|nr:glutathione S-transferase family protein [Prosthecomicrobium pneumaticum]MBB5754799.1 glutathione S-transferase [Prosthecomicrobium pneumaticum]
MSLVLYDYALDENCYKVRLLLSILGVPHETVAIDMFPGSEHRGPAFLALNPRGTLPALFADGLLLTGAEAILAYLAERFDESGTWLPADPAAFGAVLSWLHFAVDELSAAARARAHAMTDAPADEAAVVAAARAALRLMDDHMTKREFSGGRFFVGETPTIADLALFPAFALSRDYGIDHDEFPALRRWIRRVRAVSGFLTMPGIPDYH